MPNPRKRKSDDSRTVSLTIDRVETGTATGAKSEPSIAVLLTDDGTTINVPRTLLPDGASPGDILTVTFRRDAEATRRVAESTSKVQDDLKATDPGGDIRL